MYSIRYETDGAVSSLIELSSLDDAMACWEELITDRQVRILPDPQTGLDISLPRTRSFEGIPQSWALMAS